MTDAPSSQPYRVLARKYRPSDFSDLIGQEAMVRTLRNAIESARLAHAFVLTGVRGVGKTTTARIIARALTCIGADGSGGPTIAPCGVCDHCRAIAEDRHVDVLEMDAASRTGVGDIREIIESVRYAPSVARFKIYIIDEVHMLSTAAFNALLKTLEEPPPHVKFIFATTEIRKIPITVLSRCQRFDLRRVSVEDLSAHFAKIAAKEGVSVDPAALMLIARAADGSVRDGLSILDQAISHGAGTVTEAQMREMLNLVDKSFIIDLVDAAMKGEIAAALSLVADRYAGGADPVIVLQDMLDLIHALTRLKILPAAGLGADVDQSQAGHLTEMASKLSIASLTRAWQMVLKGLNETRQAPHPLQSLEMCLIRLAFAADLPSPADMVQTLKNSPPSPAASGASVGHAPNGGGAIHGNTALSLHPSPRSHAIESLAPSSQIASLPDMPSDFPAIVKLCEEKREIVLATELKTNVHLVACEPGKIELHLKPSASADLVQKLRASLLNWTGRQWQIVISDQSGQPTLREQSEQNERARRDHAASHPLVRAILTRFEKKGAEISRVTDIIDDQSEGDSSLGFETIALEEDESE